MPEGYHEQRFTRWTKYGALVRKLTIDLAVITSSERSFLVEKAAGQDLLPKLDCLVISQAPFNKDPGWGNEYFANVGYAEHMTLLFIAKSLSTLAISYRYVSGLDFNILASRCPRLRDIRIGCYQPWSMTFHSDFYGLRLFDYNPNQPTEKERDLGYMAKSMPLNLIDNMAHWKFLSRLTLHVELFPDVCLAHLCRLPVLETLTIFPPDDHPRDVQLMQWVHQQGTFPMLRELIIRLCSPGVAKPLFACKFLLERLECVGWALDPWSGSVCEKDFEDVLQLLAQHTVALKTLHIYSPLTPRALGCWSHLSELPALSELYLSTERFGRDDWDRQCFSALAGACTRLKKLSLGRRVPITMLPDFAVFFPLLTHLRLQLHDSAWRGLLKCATVVESPNSIVLEVVRSHKQLPEDNEDTLLRTLIRRVRIMYLMISY